jgi:quercetin dioxygenase-like cupin family protein
MSLDNPTTHEKAQNLEFRPTAPTLLDGKPDFVVCSADDARRIPGRRSFFEYLDFGMRGASGGQLNAQVVRASASLPEPTGWHYHTCEAQLIYLAQGWVDTDFENGFTGRIPAGSFIMIPGGYRHNEISTAPDLVTFEVILGEMGTIPCPQP